MIEMIVRIERRFHWHRAYGTKSIHLERSTRGTDKTLKQKRAVFSGKKATVAHGLQAFGGIGNGGVETIADPSDRGETFVGHHVWDKRKSFCSAAINGGNGSKFAMECSAAKDEVPATKVRREKR